MKNKRINTLLKYSSAKYIALVIGFLKEIINAKLLGPELLGVVGNLFLILTYLSYSNIGILYAMNREYPLYKDTNSDKAKKVLDTSFTFLIGVSAILLLCGLFLVTINIKNNNYEMGIYYILVFIIAIFDQFRQYFINYYRCIGKIGNINKMELVNNISCLLIILLLISNFKVYAVLSGTLVSLCLVTIFNLKNSNQINIKIDKKILRDLISFGIPLLIYNLGYYILITVDRLIIIKYLNKSDLGFYTFANQMSLATLVFLQSILFLNYNEYIKLLNKNNLGSPNDSIFIVEKGEKIVELLGGTLIVLGSIIIVPFVNIVVPQYIQSINIYRILVIAVVFYKLSSYSNIYIVSNKHQRILVLLQVITIVFSVIINLLFLKFGYGLIGVCLATAIGNFFYSVMQTITFLVLIKSKNKFNIIYRIYIKSMIVSTIVIIFSLFNVNLISYSVLLCLVYAAIYFKDIRIYLKKFDLI
ncbi:MAG: lipopolysaccharide biosynthesis protein [Bacteroidales bacterium]